MSQELIDRITCQMIEISTTIHTIKNTEKEIIKILNKNSTPIFSRIIENSVKICSYCNKNALYVDMDNKYYCWFDRVQIEE
jgi:hypothetical protein